MTEPAAPPDITALEGQPHPHGRYAIVVSRYNENITGKLLRGALQRFQEAGAAPSQITLAWTPGAWELPVVAQQLAYTGSFSAIVCLGCVIRGETTHDQHINQQVSQSLGRIALEHRLPVIFGVLTCNTLEQAIQRAGGNHGNKGRDCAEAALRMADLLRQIR